MILLYYQTVAVNSVFESFGYHYTAWKVSKYGVFSGPYFSVRMRENKDQKKLRICTLFKQCYRYQYIQKQPFEYVLRNWCS